MSAPNAFISNGTCYYDAGERAAAWLPCGNAALGDKTCCSQGDMCLSSQACYNPRYGITYLAGCTDPEYASPSCPQKGEFQGGLPICKLQPLVAMANLFSRNADQPWTGLVYCNGTSEEWVACKQSGRPATLTSADACWCPQTSRTVAFRDSSVLANVVQLPTALGGSVIWQPGYVPIPTQPDAIPTETSVATTADNLPTSASMAISSSVPIETEAAAAEDEEEMNSEAKIGVGVGVGIGSTVLIVVLIYLFFARRKLQRQDMEELARIREERGKRDASSSGTVDNSEFGHNMARPWSTRTELDGTPRSSAGILDGHNPQTYDYMHNTWSGRSSSMTKTGNGRPPSPIAELPAS